MRHRHLALPALLACLSLAACGGSGSPTSTATTAKEAPTTAGSKRAQPPKDAFVAPLRAPGGGSGRFLVPGGDNSVQEYGEEAGQPELREAAEAVHSFYVSRVKGAWQRACSLLSQPSLEGLERLAARSPALRGKGCPATLAAMTKRVSAPLARQATTVDAASLRREGEQAFLIYTAPPGRTAYAMPLLSEGGEWKLGAISGAVLPGA